MNELDMTGLLIKLANLGVTGIKVKYDGSGDSGAIEWIGYTTESCETPEDVDNHMNDWSNEDNLANLNQEAFELIETFAEGELLNDIEDWWNNEGGWGDLCICVPSGKYEITNNVRVTDHETFTHEGSLIEKSAE